MNELLNTVIFVIYSLLFWAAMGVGILMTVVVGMAIWNALFHRR